MADALKEAVERLDETVNSKVTGRYACNVSPEDVRTVLAEISRLRGELCAISTRCLDQAIRANAAEARERVKDEALKLAHADLLVIHKASACAEGSFGGRMSVVDRIFQNITRVAGMHIARALTQETPHAE